MKNEKKKKLLFQIIVRNLPGLKAKRILMINNNMIDINYRHNETKQNYLSHINV